MGKIIIWDLVERSITDSPLSDVSVVCFRAAVSHTLH